MNLASREPNRRGFLGAFVFGAAAAIGGAITALASRFLVAGRAKADRTRRISVGTARELPKGTEPVERVLSYSAADGYFVSERRERIFLLPRTGEPPIALSATCTHLGCGVSWDARSRLFRCPCHGGAYHPDGSVASGPPPRPLAKLPVEITPNGEISITLKDDA